MLVQQERERERTGEEANETWTMEYEYVGVYCLAGAFLFGAIVCEK